MRRRLFNALTLLSLLLCVGVCALWVRCHRALDELSFGRPVSDDNGGDSARWSRVITLYSQRGVLAMSAGRWKGAPGYLRGWHWRTEGPTHRGGFPMRDEVPRARMQSYSLWNRLGFGAYRAKGTNFADDVLVVAAPTWLVAALTAALPACRLAAELARRRRAANGLCPRCGYDLRATPDRCPECGTAAPRAAASGSS